MRVIQLKLIALLLLISTGVRAGDSLRILSYPRDIHVYARLGPLFTHFSLHNPDVSNDLQFRPNTQADLNLGFYYSWFGMNLSITSTENKNEERYGHTKRFDFETHYSMRRVMIDFAVRKYTGYYIDNPGDFISGWKMSNPYPQISDLKTSSVSASVSYVFRPDKFSPRAAYRFTQSQRRSGGSWMVGGFASSSRITTDSSIVPSAIRAYIDLKYDLKTIAFQDLGASFGYSYLYSFFNKYFVSGTLMPGLAYQYVRQQSSLDGSKNADHVLSLRTTVRLSLGYNGEKYYWGMSAFQESTFVKNEDTSLSFNTGQLYFFVGYRINTDNWRFMKKVDQVLHPPGFKFITGKAPERK